MKTMINGSLDAPIHVDHTIKSINTRAFEQSHYYVELVRYMYHHLFHNGVHIICGMLIREEMTIK